MDTSPSIPEEELIDLNVLYSDVTAELIIEFPLEFEGTSIQYKSCIPAPTKEAAWEIYERFRGNKMVSSGNIYYIHLS